MFLWFKTSFYGLEWPNGGIILLALMTGDVQDTLQVTLFSAFLDVDIGNTGICGQPGFGRNPVFFIAVLYHYRRYIWRALKIWKVRLCPTEDMQEMKINAGKIKGADMCIIHHMDWHIPVHTAYRCKRSSSFHCSHKLLSAQKKLIKAHEITAGT